jgi:hypothetical protein
MHGKKRGPICAGSLYGDVHPAQLQSGAGMPWLMQSCLHALQLPPPPPQPDHMIAPVITAPASAMRPAMRRRAVMGRLAFGASFKGGIVSFMCSH